jgi:hypothetical protein
MSSEAVPESGLSKSITPARFFLVVAIALLLLKLVLVSQREIVPEQHDADAYSNASLYSLRLVFLDSAGHPPGAALVMGLARSMGIPYRVFIEIFLAAAAFLFFRPLVVSMRLSLAAASALYALLLFHPTLMLEMDRAMSDAVGFSLWLAGAGGIIGFVAAPRGRLAYLSLALAVGSFAFAGITRSGEGAIVIVEMLAVALLSILLFRGPHSWRWRRAAVACFCAAVANLAATQALSAVHSINKGYWGASPVESREWFRLYSTLLSLPVERVDRRILINKNTMEKAQSFSEDLRRMTPCLQEVAEDNPPEGIMNEGVAWVVIGCLPGKDSEKEYSILNKISDDIIVGARESNLQLSAPVLGIVPRPIAQWLSSLPPSILEVALDVVEMPHSTRVAQSSWHEELFDQALLRRTALVARGENPQVFGYKSLIRPLYETLAALFWPSALLVAVAIATFFRKIGKIAAKTDLIAFALSVMLIDVLCRVSFYSLVAWMLWELPPRYVLGPSVLSTIVVATLLTVWLAPAAARALGLRPMRIPGLAWAENLGHPSRRA